MSDKVILSLCISPELIILIIPVFCEHFWNFLPFPPPPNKNECECVDLNGSKLGSCKLCRKVGGGKEQIYKNEIFIIQY